MIQFLFTALLPPLLVSCLKSLLSVSMSALLIFNGKHLQLELKRSRCNVWFVVSVLIWEWNRSGLPLRGLCQVRVKGLHKGVQLWKAVVSPGPRSPFRSEPRALWLQTPCPFSVHTVHVAGRRDGGGTQWEGAMRSEVPQEYQHLRFPFSRITHTAIHARTHPVCISHQSPGCFVSMPSSRKMNTF